MRLASDEAYLGPCKLCKVTHTLMFRKPVAYLNYMIHSRIYNSNQNHHSGNFQKVLKTEEKIVPDKIKNFYNY